MQAPRRLSDGVWPLLVRERISERRHLHRNGRDRRRGRTRPLDRVYSVRGCLISWASRRSRPGESDIGRMRRVR